MKKIGFILLLLTLVSTSTVYSQNTHKSCYRGIIDVGYTIGIDDYEFGRFEINTSHGYQVNPHFFIGVGFGFHYMSEYKTPKMDIPLDIRDSSIDIPIFGNIKCNFTKSKIVPFIDLKAGTYITHNGGLYANASAGCRISTKGKQAFNISIGYTMQELEFETFDEFYGISSMDYSRESRKLETGGIAIKIGYEF